MLDIKLKECCRKCNYADVDKNETTVRYMREKTKKASYNFLLPFAGMQKVHGV